MQARVPVDLIRRLRIEAVQRGVHPRDIIIVALEKELPSEERKVRRAS